jgi:multiple sugar transport system substrate-binding protein
MAAAGMLARPFIANAAAKTATVWWSQGFAEEEDIAFKKIVADYQKASGNTVDYTIMPFAPLRQKIVSAVTSGVVPDLFQNNPVEMLALYAWDNKLVDLTDVIETQKPQYSETALLTAYCYNSVEKRRGYYCVPYTFAVRPNHVWRPLVEQAGYKIEDVPKTWDAYYNFFKEVQNGLRGQGVRKVYGMGFQLNTTGNDSNALFDYFLIAYGGKDIVTKDGKLNIDDPQVREAAIKTVSYPTTAYKEGFVPPGAINWNDADDNNAFHSKLIVMDLDGTISTEVAIVKNKQDYDDIVTMGLALSNDGKPVPSEALHTGGLIPQGAKNIDVAKEFLKFLIQPQTLSEYLKTGLGRNIPCMPSIANNDPWWTADPHRKAYVEQGLLGPTVPNFWVFNPGYASVENTHVWPMAWADVISGGLTPEAAVDKAFRRVAEIFAKYRITQG